MTTQTTTTTTTHQKRTRHLDQQKLTE